jgi:hypothetical protein
MLLFDSADHFQISEGTAPIVVGAPHHGTRPNVNADLGTGPIALALAQRLKARAVVVSDLRRTVDVNKNPAHLASNVRAHALRYQNEMFRAAPRFVVEVHGQMSGQYAIELSTGFDLDRSSPGDACFWDKLVRLKQVLPAALSSKIGQAPTLGIYPLDRDVQKTATDTFTFQKIRRARNLAGAEWCGLHIELNAELRTSQQAKSPAFIDALAEAFASAFQTVFEPLPPADTTLPTHADQPDGTTALISSHMLRVIRAPEKYVSANVVVVHPSDLEALSALDGDAVILRHGHEELRSTITPSLTIQPGHAALPARVRRQISLGERSRVTIGRPAPINPTVNRSHQHARFVAAVLHRDQQRLLWLSPADIERLGLRRDQSVQVQGQAQLHPLNATIVKPDETLLPGRAAISHGLQKALLLSLGEVIALHVRAIKRMENELLAQTHPA